MRAGDVACATSIVVVLALGACSSGDQKVTSGCRMPRGHAVAVGGSERMTIGFGDRGATAWFNRRWWGSPPLAPPQVVSLHGRMTLVRTDLAVFHADDGRTMTFGYTTVGCG